MPYMMLEMAASRFTNYVQDGYRRQEARSDRVDMAERADITGHGETYFTLMMCR